MNDKSDIEDERDESGEDALEESSEDAAGPVAGMRLAAARREQQISLDDVAKELHLDEQKVRALEKNQFESLGAPVFAKGHLRKYAMLVGISVEEAIAEYESLNQAADEPPVVGLHGRGQPRDFATGSRIALIAVVVLLGVISWWLIVREPTAPAPESTAETAETVSPVVDGAPSEPAEGIDEDAPVAEADDERPEPAEELAESEPVVETAAIDDDQSTLTLRFSGDCWTEISDSRGERLFFGLGRDGGTAELVGVAPFSVLFGDADNVSVNIDGEPYAIPVSARRGAMARLTIDSR
jgi:cytoskeleton protein RodZ